MIMSSPGNKPQPEAVRLYDAYQQYFASLAEVQYASPEESLRLLPSLRDAAHAFRRNQMPLHGVICEGVDIACDNALDGIGLTRIARTALVTDGLKSLVYSGLAVSPPSLDFIKESFHKTTGSIVADIKPSTSLIKDLRPTTKAEEARFRSLGYSVLASPDLVLRGKIRRRVAGVLGAFYFRRSLRMQSQDQK